MKHSLAAGPYTDTHKQGCSNSGLQCQLLASVDYVVRAASQPGNMLESRRAGVHIFLHHETECDSAEAYLSCITGIWSIRRGNLPFKGCSSYGEQGEQVSCVYYMKRKAAAVLNKIQRDKDAGVTKALRLKLSAAKLSAKVSKGLMLRINWTHHVESDMFTAACDCLLAFFTSWSVPSPCGVIIRNLFHQPESVSLRFRVATATVF